MNGFSAEELKAKKEARAEAREKAQAQSSNIFTKGSTPPQEDLTQDPGEDTAVGTQAEALAQVVAEVQEGNSESESLEPVNTSENKYVEETVGVEKPAALDTLEESSPNTTTVVAVGNSSEGVTQTTLEPAVEETAATSSTEEPVQVIQPRLGESNVFKNLSDNADSSPAEVNGSYAELVENMISRQCQLSGVTNLDLTSFGVRSQSLEFPNLTVLTYGIHKFLGRPFTKEEEDAIVHILGLYVAQSEKDEVTVSAVKEVRDSSGMSFYSLMFNDEIAQKFANVFKHTVKA
ncbi:hypothetical protein, partial [Lysinibacillus xylanilyticus]|uniref:hypothetical protein n=1 Tax=Lysinibacillus xylanilyticus TaxID=582475 RepID=UPI0036DF49CF